CVSNDLRVVAELLADENNVSRFRERSDIFDVLECVSRKDRDRVFFRTLATSVLKYLEDEWILLFDFPHLIEQVGGRSASAIYPPASNTTRDISRNAIRER